MRTKLFDNSRPSLKTLKRKVKGISIRRMLLTNRTSYGTIVAFLCVSCHLEMFARQACKDKQDRPPMTTHPVVSAHFWKIYITKSCFFVCTYAAGTQPQIWGCSPCWSYVREKLRHWANYSCNKMWGSPTYMISVRRRQTGQTDGRTDGRTDNIRWHYPPMQ